MSQTATGIGYFDTFCFINPRSFHFIRNISAPYYLSNFTNENKCKHLKHKERSSIRPALYAGLLGEVGILLNEVAEFRNQKIQNNGNSKKQLDILFHVSTRNLVMKYPKIGPIKIGASTRH